MTQLNPATTIASPLRIAMLVLLHAALGTTAHAAVGRTAGDFGVSQGGAASYTIPLWTPPGVNGLAPSLALVYSSNGGNGFYGVGWNLSGLSTITRCSQTWAQDGTPRQVLLFRVRIVQHHARVERQQALRRSEQRIDVDLLNPAVLDHQSAKPHHQIFQRVQVDWPASANPFQRGV